MSMTLASRAFSRILLVAVPTATACVTPNRSHSRSDSPAAPDDIADPQCDWVDSTCARGDCGDGAWKSLVEQLPDQQVAIPALLYLIDYADPVAAAENTLERGFRPRADLDYWPIGLPLDWSADPYGDSNWMFQLQAWRILDPLIGAFESQPNGKFGDLALRYALDWAEFHLVRARTSALEWYDMSTGLRALKLAYLLEQTLRNRIATTAEQRELLLRLAAAHVVRLSDPTFISGSNHGLFQVHGLVALCSTVPHLAGCAGGRPFGIAKFGELLLQQFAEDGGHKEHSPAYHLFAFDIVSGFAESGWYASDPATSALFRRVQANNAWMVFPSGDVVEIGDSDPRLGADEIPTPGKMCELAIGGRCYGSRLLPKTGYAIVRSDATTPVSESSMLFMAASFHSTVHKHADGLSFEWFEGGEKLVVDSGKYGYVDDEVRSYVLSRRAHNTVEVDRDDSGPRPKEAYGSGVHGIQVGDWGFELRGSIRRQNSAVEHSRSVLYRPREWLAVLDEMVADEPHVYSQWFHFPSGSTIAGSSQNLVMTTPGGTDVHVRALSQDCKVRTAEGMEKPRLEGWVTVSYLSVAPAPALAVTCEGTQRRIATVLALSESGIAAATARLAQVEGRD